MPEYKRGPKYNRIPSMKTRKEPVSKKIGEGKGIVDINEAIGSAIDEAKRRGNLTLAGNLELFRTRYSEGKEDIIAAKRALEEARKSLSLPNGGVVPVENIERAIKNHFSELPPQHLRALIKTLRNDPENLKRALRYLQQVGEFKPGKTS